MSSSTWISLVKFPWPSIGASSCSTWPRSLSSMRACSSSRSLSPPGAFAEISRPCWSATRTASGDMPGTDPATRLTIAETWLSASWRPLDRRTMTEADGGAFSRTKTDFSPCPRWTRTASTPSISMIVSISSCSRAARRRSPSRVRLAPIGRLSSMAWPLCGRSQRAIRGGEHAGAVIVALGDRQRAGGVIDAIGDRGLVERIGDAGALAVAELGIERALGRGGQAGPGDTGEPEGRHTEEQRHGAAHRGLTGKGAQPRHRAAAGRICERREDRRLRRGGERLGHLSNSHSHDVLIGGQQPVPDLQGSFEGHPGFLPGEHDLGDIGDFAALVGLAQRFGFVLRCIDAVERGLERIGEAGALPGLLRGGRGLADLLEQLRAVDDLLAQRQDVADASPPAPPTPFTPFIACLRLLRSRPHGTRRGDSAGCARKCRARARRRPGCRRRPRAPR